VAPHGGEKFAWWREVCPGLRCSHAVARPTGRRSITQPPGWTSGPGFPLPKLFPSSRGMPHTYRNLCKEILAALRFVFGYCQKKVALNKSHCSVNDLALLQNTADRVNLPACGNKAAGSAGSYVFA